MTKKSVIDTEDVARDKYDRLFEPRTVFDLHQVRKNGFNLVGGRFTTLRAERHDTHITLVARRHDNGDNVCIPASKLHHFAISFPSLLCGVSD